MRATLLEIRDLSVSIGGKRILSGAHLAIREREIFGLLGPNGAGKSTTIAAALGLLEPDGGSITMFGRQVTGDIAENRRRLGVLPERTGFYDWMTAGEYLTFFAALHGQDLDDSQRVALLGAVGLRPCTRQRIRTFSQGMRQRLALARTMIGDPMLLILDEPTNGLDPRGRREFHDILRGLASSGVGVLLCTHLLDDVERLCHRIGIIVGGRTVAEGEIGDLLCDTGHPARFRLRLVGDPPKQIEPEVGVSIVAREGDWLILDTDPRMRVDAIWRGLMLSGWPIAEICRKSGGLEDLYLSLTEASAA
jgi:ABC-2 type transport system ATP-binding protein